jgi:molybdopterin converting factor subunit 1
VHVRLFAVARELAGSELVTLEVAPGCTIAQLRGRLAAQVPALAETLRHVLFAVGSEYVTDETVVPPETEVACIPPVSGG